ncbi:MAG: 3-deoxy-manno-octulosonate cytidylyltransferase [Gammaproteobacteria bacterium]|nr:3-deoxy-manno-octulosonate cytidylyltransferase [Gammaproteobacteria bacterium]
MKIGFLITARLKSSRLPMKLMLPLNGRSVVERVMDRAKQVLECEDVVLCTSTANQDLPLIRKATENDIYYFAGDPDDVLARLLDAANLFGFDYILGITADNPLFSIYHANLLADRIRWEPEIDFIYTTGLPLGTNLYAIKVKALETVCRVKQVIDTEIWGYLINRPEIFNVLEMKAAPEFGGDFRLTLDEMADYELFSSLYNEFGTDEIPDLLDVLRMLRRDTELAQLNSHIIQRDLDAQTKQAIDAYYRENLAQVKSIKDDIYGVQATNPTG